jgi:diguanylate cyclase (GGDEF)-like protein
MLHLPTLVFAAAVQDLFLAAALWVASAPSARRGVLEWTIALGLQAAMFALFGARGPGDPALSSVLLTTLFGAGSLLAMGAAIYSFHVRRTPVLIWVACVIATTGVATMLITEAQVRVAVTGVIYGVATTGLAYAAVRFHPGTRRLGVRLAAAAFLLQAVLLFGRALLAMIRPAAFAGFQGNGGPGVASALFVQVFTLLQSLGFLLMHRERQEENIERLAMTDALTGVYNRRTLFELGEKELDRARRAGSPLSVVILDLDNFKRINDTHGHQAGDAVLQRFVEVVRGCLRSADILTRYGGEEFCILLPDAPSGAAQAVAERIREAVESSPFTVGKVTSSAGVASLTADAPSLSALVGRADEALYAAKREGRNRVVVAH